MAHWLRKVPKVAIYSTEEDSDSKEKPISYKRRKSTIKSHKFHTTDTTVPRQNLWLHELVYGPGGQPAIYDELLLPLFIQGYLVIIELERPAQKDAILKYLSELMADAASYSAGILHCLSLATGK